MIESDELATRAHDVSIRVRAVHGRIVTENANAVLGEKPGCVEASVGAAISGALYAQQERDEPDPIHIAAFLLRYLAKNHCFTDGNKRVAWASAVDYLQGAGYGLVATQGDAAEFVESVASGLVTEARDIATWLADHLTDIAALA